MMCMGFSVNARINNFTLTVTPTNETCLGNGTLTFSTTGVSAGATITYYVYQLPDETNAIAIQTANFLDGRTSGNYKIIAIQTLGAEQNSQTVFATITNNITPLSYYITSTPSTCNNGVLTVVVTNGIGAEYEIIAGPVIRPIQNSPIFTSLPGGVYQVRVYNNCGDATVITHTLLTVFSNLTIGSVSFPNPILPTCNSIEVSNLITSNASISYPLTLNYSIHFPNGTVQNTTQTVTTGLQSEHEALAVLPFFYDQSYYYDLSVTDGCGNTYTMNNNVINLKFSVSISAEDAVCGAYYLKISASTYTPNLQLQFTQTPSGFDPTLFNINHPGPFFGPEVNYGSPTNAVPFGSYGIQVSDGCGHSAIAQITLIDQPSIPTEIIIPNLGCDSNRSKITIKIPRFSIVSAIITIAPAAYGSTPDDVSEFITPDNELELLNLISGDYTVLLTDECGNSYTYSFTIPGLATSVSSNTWPGCEIGKGSVRIRGNNTILTSVIILNAPATFSQTVPYDATSFIGGGIFSMGNLFPGNYTFKVLDNCGEEKTVTINVTGYEITSDTFAVTARCGSFDLSLNHTSNAISELFWLQKYNYSTATWEHPQSGVTYIEGSQPNSTNSFLIQNNFININLIFLGHFRIIKTFQSFENGNIAPFKTCIEILREFDFTGEIQFTGIEKTNCNGTFMDVNLFAVGVPPLTYSIIEKNGNPFLVNNGTNSLFTNLEPAIYTFKVEQSCGDSRNFISDVAQLPSLAIANQPSNLVACDDVSNDGKELFNLIDQNVTILGNQNATLYAISYHNSLADATTNVNPLTSTINSANTTIYSRLSYNAAPDCFDIVTFDLVVNPYPVTNSPIDINFCEGESTSITVPNGYASYTWSTGQTSPSIMVNQPGQYSVNVVKNYPLGSCIGQIVYNVTTTSPPSIDYIETTDWTDNQNSITVFLNSSSTGTYLYSLDNTTYQTSNIFTGLNSGFYTVYVKDPQNCGIDEKNVVLLNYPHYFTPNGDGIHDFWSVKFSQIEPKMKTYIYDRFGKLIAAFTPESPGWDGKYNGEMLPSTDYWFLIIRENGEHYRGHFAMKR